jgi:methyl-accepting chemotaxis protein
VFDLVVPISTIVLTVLGTVGSLTWWLSSQFSSTRNLVDTKVEKLENNILAKLEYHERHDDDRFSSIHHNFNERLGNIQEAVWDLRVRNAAVDGMQIPARDKSK